VEPPLYMSYTCYWLLTSLVLLPLSTVVRRRERRAEHVRVSVSVDDPECMIVRETVRLARRRGDGTSPA
jgi:hypothetical protein